MVMAGLTNPPDGLAGFWVWEMTGGRGTLNIELRSGFGALAGMTEGVKKIKV